LPPIAFAAALPVARDLRPFHNARHAHVKDSGHRPTSFATRNQSDNAFTQIEEIRSPSMLASCSSMESESDDSRFGNPQRFIQNQKDSS
jgi:hypothetical protein